METEVILNEVKEQPKVWSNMQIFFATGFGGFVSGYFLIKENYTAMGLTALSKKALILGILSTLILFSTVVFLSEVYVDRILLGLNVALGLLGGCYLMYEHYKRVHHWKLFKQTVLFALIAPPAIMAVPFFLPETVMGSMPKFMFFFLQALTMQGVAQQLQEQPVKELIQSGSKKYSNWRLFLITLVAFVAQMVILFALLLIHH